MQEREKPRVCRAFRKSGRQDLNLRPPGPQPGALPDCATPRMSSPEAGDGNRTRPKSLEGSCATTTLRPRAATLRRMISAPVVNDDGEIGESRIHADSWRPYRDPA